MLRQILSIPYSCRTLCLSIRPLHDRVSPKRVGFSLIKNGEKDEPCPFSSFKQFNIETKEKRHSFDISCDRVVQFIKLGAINKQIAIQYCHYLAHLTRNSESPDDVAYFAQKCADITSFVLRNEKDLPNTTVVKLLSDVADTTKDNCAFICSHLLSAPSWKEGYYRAAFAQLLGSCYKLGLWDNADRILDKAPTRFVTISVVDPCVQGVITASKRYKELVGCAKEQEVLRSKVIKSLTKLFKICYIERVQLVTRWKADFIKALEALDMRIRINPNIKLSGRCTNCETHIPLFDNQLVSEINASIREQLLKGADKGLYLNTSPNDSNRFDEFLQNLYSCDRRPIDCVIDGLNIAYRSSTGYDVLRNNVSDVMRTRKIPRPESQAKTLINCIIRGDMLRRFKKILVVGKYHMIKWPYLMDFFKKHNIHFYSSYNNSKDDLFQLYAATMHHKTTLVTNDFLRDHLASLDENDRNSLERWVDTHQVWICQKNLEPIWPTPYEKLPHINADDTVFHLPLIDYNQLDLVGVYEPPPHLSSKLLTWVCCDLQPVRDSTNKEK